MRVQRQRAEREAAASDFAAFGHDATVAPRVDPAETLAREQALLASAAAAAQRRAAKEEAAKAAAAALASGKEPKSEGAQPSMTDSRRAPITAVAAGPADPKAAAPASRGAKRAQRRRRLQDAPMPAAQTLAGGTCAGEVDAAETAFKGVAPVGPPEPDTAGSLLGSFRFDVPSIIAAMAL